MESQATERLIVDHDDEDARKRKAAGKARTTWRIAYCDTSVHQPFKNINENNNNNNRGKNRIRMLQKFDKIMFDTVKFIREVEKRRSIYDMSSKFYNNRAAKMKCWSEVAKVMYADWSDHTREEKEIKLKDLVKKWKAIRDCYVRDFKKKSTGKKQRRYIYHDNLVFLEPHIRAYARANLTNRNNKLKLNQEPQHSSSEENETSNENFPTIEEITEEDNQTTIEQNRNNIQLYNKNEEIQNPLCQIEENVTDLYGHKTFLMSFVPILNTFPLNLALQARLEISQVVSRIHAKASHEQRIIYEHSDNSCSRYVKNEEIESTSSLDVKEDF